MSLAAVLAVIYGLKQIAQDGLGWLPALSIVVGLALGVVFLRRQRTLADPLIDVRLFRVPAFSASLATYTLGIFVVSEHSSSSRCTCSRCSGCRRSRRACGRCPRPPGSSPDPSWAR